jgi:hypothetical protein
MSAMETMCPECAHHLYGYGACDHVMTNGHCERCHWDGSISDFIKRRWSD